MEHFHLNITLPVKNQADVIVIGGGSAGFTAAVHAARSGARTILIEKNGMLGGTTTTAYVNFPGLFHAWGKQVIGGIGWEAIERTAAYGGAVLPDFTVIPTNHWEHQVHVNRFTYAAVLDELCQEAGVEVHLHEMPAFVQESEEGITLITAAKEGGVAYTCKVLVDATGDADVVGLLGYPRVRSEFLQPGTLMNTIKGHDIEKIDFVLLKRKYEQAVMEGTLYATDCQFSQRPFENELKTAKINMHITDIDASTSQGKTEAELKSRQALHRILSFLKSIPGCEHIEADFVAEECGIRETYRIDGEDTITYEDYVNGKLYGNSVCYSFYPIDLHLHNSSGIKQIFLKNGVVPTIPYGALIPKGATRLLTAGRCISGDTDANSAYRVQSTCMATGQAAGAAAALAARFNTTVKEVDYSELCAELAKHGAIVPK